MKKGRAGTMTYDYIRNGTTTLFAALNVLNGTVIGQCMARHRHQEFIRFLNRIEAVVPAGKLIHAILDNYAAHTHPRSAPGLPAIRGGRFTSPRPRAPGPMRSKAFSPPSPADDCSAASSDSLVDLQAAINRYLGEHNRKPKPFVWTADPDRIIEKVNRGHQAIASYH